MPSDTFFDHPGLNLPIKVQVMNPYFKMGGHTERDFHFSSDDRLTVKLIAGSRDL